MKSSPLPYPLASGRRLGWQAWGAAASTRVVVHLHGFPGSRLEAGLADQVARNAGVTLLAVERPGYGLSSRCPDLSLAEWAGGLGEALRDLAGASFGVLGVSGGAPAAVAFAATLPDRVSRLALVGGMGPLREAGSLETMSRLNRLGLRLTSRAPWLVAPVTGLVGLVARHGPGLLVRRLQAVTPAPDRATLADPRFAGVLAESFREGVRAGGAGMAWDARVFVSDWAALLGPVAAPVRLWHGAEDVIVPPAVGIALARSLPGARLELVPGEGHFSLIARRGEEVLRWAAGLDS